MTPISSENHSKLLVKSKSALSSAQTASFRPISLHHINLSRPLCIFSTMIGLLYKNNQLIYLHRTFSFLVAILYTSLNNCLIFEEATIPPIHSSTVLSNLMRGLTLWYILVTQWNSSEFQRNPGRKQKSVCISTAQTQYLLSSNEIMIEAQHFIFLLKFVSGLSVSDF